MQAIKKLRVHADEFTERGRTVRSVRARVRSRDPPGALSEWLQLRERRRNPRGRLRQTCRHFHASSKRLQSCGLTDPTSNPHDPFPFYARKPQPGVSRRATPQDPGSTLRERSHDTSSVWINDEYLTELCVVVGCDDIDPSGSGRDIRTRPLRSDRRHTGQGCNIVTPIKR